MTNIPSPPDKEMHDANYGSADAAEIIRHKLDNLYAAEPDATEELRESNAVRHLSKHQKFMHELGTSGKDLATIQTQWHAYYQSLPDNEKHQVWSEFYSSHSAVTNQVLVAAPAPKATSPIEKKTPRSHKKPTDTRSVRDVRETIRHNVSGGGKLTAKHHIQALLFGLGVGGILIIILLFGLFNEVVLAPLYQPSRHASATPLILDSSGAAPTDKTEVIIPKINLEVPVDYSIASVDETNIQDGLERGIVHYPTTANPGENGNAAFFGHSSSNIFNKGKYKFAFVLLHAITPGDTFYITYNKKIYVYKVISRTVVDPGDVSVLNPIDGQAATATLITCDPPGTSFRRLIIVGQQISPDPSGNQVAKAPSNDLNATPVSLPGNGQTFAAKLVASVAGKTSIVLIVLILASTVVRRMNKSN
jgi:LPXTG-site transpeptidase (sortase) family protein